MSAEEAKQLIYDWLSGKQAYESDQLDLLVKQIQLDAHKAGMTESAEICIKYKDHGDLHPPIFTRGAILHARDNKTLGEYPLTTRNQI